MGRGWKSLIAVITSRLLLREEKQGTTTLRLSFDDDFIRCQTAFYVCQTRE
jgi:hypothetical protein